MPDFDRPGSVRLALGCALLTARADDIVGLTAFLVGILLLVSGFDARYDRSGETP